MKFLSTTLVLFSFVCEIAYAKNYYLVNEETKSQKICSPLVKPVKYKVAKGDHLADLIRTFGYKPEFKAAANVDKMSKKNNLVDANIIQPQQELFIPFKCEEHTKKYVLVDHGSYRLIDENYLVKVKTEISDHGKLNSTMLTPHGNIVAFDATLNARPKMSNSKQLRYTASAPTDEETQSMVQPVIIPTKNFRVHSILSIGGIFGYSRIDSTEIFDNSTALLLSKPIYGLSTGLDFKWNPKFSTGLHIDLQKIDMRKSTLTTLSDADQTLTGLSLKTSYNLTHKLKSLLYFNYKEQLYVNSLSLGTALIQVYQEPALTAQLEYRLLNVDSLSLDAMLGYSYKVGAELDSVKITSGNEYQMGVRLRQQLDKMQIELKVDYTKSQQDSSFSNQEVSNLKTQIGIKMRVGK